MNKMKKGYLGEISQLVAKRHGWDLFGIEETQIRLLQDKFPYPLDGKYSYTIVLFTIDTHKEKKSDLKVKTKKVPNGVQGEISISEHFTIQTEEYVKYKLLAGTVRELVTDISAWRIYEGYAYIKVELTSSVKK